MPDPCCEPTPPDVSQPAFDAEDVARMCKALGHPARVLLLRHLVAYGGCYFGSLADVLPLAPSTISQHVSILKDAGLIEGAADEQRVCYCVNPARLKQLKLAIAGL